MRVLGAAAGEALDDPASAILAIDRNIARALRDPAFPQAAASVPLAGSVLPWIDSAVEGGRTREEEKSGAETNKILGALCGGRNLRAGRRHLRARRRYAFS